MNLRSLFFRRRAEDDLEDELQFHLAMQARKNAAAGLKPAEAERRARVHFGGVEQVKEQCRDARGLYWIETAWRDVVYALRGFLRSPVFALTVIATIAVGLGLNATFFTVFNAYVLRPLSVRDPYSLYRFTWTAKSGDGHWFTWREFEDLRMQTGPFSEVSGRQQLIARMEGHLLFGNLVTGNYFEMLGVSAAQGRTLLPEDAAVPGSEPVVVLSHSAWKDKLGGDPNIVGKKILVRGYPLEVVGIMRPGFGGLSEVPLDFWAPLTMSPALQEGSSLFGPEQPGRIRISGRLRHELSVGQAEAALIAWSQRQTADRPDSEKAVGAVLNPEATTIPLIPEVIASATPIFVALGLVLAIACANVANMMLARAMARQREIGIRLAMGAGRARLIRQMLTESVLLALPASAAGLAIAHGAIKLGVRTIFATLPRGYLDYITLVPLEPDARVFGFMLGAAVVAALLFGLAPALQATRLDVIHAARGEFGTDVRAARLRNALVVAQVTISVLFLICAAVTLRANSKLRGLDIGLRTQGVIEIEIQERFRSKVIEQLLADPSVEMVAGASKVPLGGSLPSAPMAATDRKELDWVAYIHVSPEYFPVFRIPILRGRAFTAEEANAGAPVAVVSKATAQRLWPGRDALGRTFRVQIDSRRRHPASAPSFEAVTVVGIAPDVVNGYVGYGLDSTCVYFPAAQPERQWAGKLPQAWPGSALLVRVKGDAETERQKLDAALGVSVPGAVEQIHPMTEIQTVQLYPFLVLYWVSSAIGGLALLLTVLGIYGVLSYFVTQRTKEIGIRVALGASSASVAAMVLRQSLRLTGIGTAMGVVAALGVSRILAMVNFERVDLVSYVMGVSVALAAAACAGYVPARRAARVEPSITLRHD
jgi:predicted permease